MRALAVYERYAKCSTIQCKDLADADSGHETE